MGYTLIQRTGFPFNDLFHDCIGYFGDEACLYIGIVKLFERGADFTGGHALSVKKENLIVHTRQTRLLFFNKLWLE